MPVNPQRVAAGLTTAAYPTEPPFHPDETYPELPFVTAGLSANYPYRLFRRLLFELGLDAERFGTPAWNPFGEFIRPGETVLLKPNFVLSRNLSGGPLDAVVTHGSILRAVADYVFRALEGRGRLIIADAPQMDCQWDVLMRATGVPAIQRFYRDRLGFNLEVYDLRNFAVVDPQKPPLSFNRKPLPGDPAGSTIINLGRESAFYGLDTDRYYGADYNRRETIRHHHSDVHEYCVSNTVLSADVFISVPKMKTHKKVGVTLNLKGLVGINTNKNFLIHYRLGSPREGGDQYPDELAPRLKRKIRIQRWLYDHALAPGCLLGDLVYLAARGIYRRMLRRPLSQPVQGISVDEGNWYGNDSAWRMTADLARIIYFADRSGVLRDVPQRRFFSVVDGIIGGEGEGPLAPRAKPAGVLVVGANLLNVDLVACRLMGFDPRRLRQFDVMHDPRRVLGASHFDEIEVIWNGTAFSGASFFQEGGPRLGFAPHPAWVGHVEAAP